MLDHDVEDMQLYEDVITELKGDLDQVSEERDALANQLDQITDERDSLLGACNNLGERLKKMEKEYDDKLTRLALEKEEVKQKLQTALDSANEVRYILHSYSWSLIERLVLQMYRQQEQQLRFLEDSQLTETNLRQQAEREMSRGRREDGTRSRSRPRSASRPRDSNRVPTVEDLVGEADRTLPPAPNSARTPRPGAAATSGAPPVPPS
jgi:chromosome segregation ATPase